MASGKALLKTYAVTVLLAVVALILTWEALGILVVMVLGCWLIIWFLINLSKLQKQPARRVPFLVKSGIWVLVLTGIFLIQDRFADEARHKADAVVVLVVTYQKANGRYPNTLDDLPMTDAKLIHDSHVHYSLSTEGVPLLFYPSATMLFSNYVYQFDKGTWRALGG